MTREDVSDEMLMALADGELPEAQATALRARVERDPALTARFWVFTETRTLLGAAMDPGPVPDRLVQTILTASAGAELATTLVPFVARRRFVVPVLATALAASLALVVGLAGFELGRRAVPGLAPGGPLAAVLAVSQSPTGATVALADGGTARALGSFDTDAGFCRLIITQGPSRPAERIIACRNDGGWNVLLSVFSGNGTSFATASDYSGEMVDDMLDRLGAGMALTHDEESQRLETGDLSD